jgi:hypothetical protein
MKANSLEELVTNSNIAGELRNYTDWHTRLVKFAQLVADWQKEQMLKDCVIVECYVRVYPTLDDKPRPWVALYKNGIGCNSLRDIPELENIGFKDNDTAIVIIKRKEDGQQQST